MNAKTAVKRTKKKGLRAKRDHGLRMAYDAWKEIVEHIWAEYYAGMEELNNEYYAGMEELNNE